MVPGCRLGLTSGNHIASTCEDLVEHPFRQSSRECVLLARVKAGDDCGSIFDRDFVAMGEARARTRDDPADSLSKAQNLIEGNTAKRHNRRAGISSSGRSQREQFSSSFGVSLFSGGAQRAAAVTRQSASSKPSPGAPRLADWRTRPDGGHGIASRPSDHR